MYIFIAPVLLKAINKEAGEMPQLSAHTALAKDLSLVPKIHQAAPKSL